MYKKIQCKSFVSMFLVALMILTTGLFGMKKVFAKANGKDDELVKIEENNIITSEEIENMDVRSIINKIQSQSVGISSIREDTVVIKVTLKDRPNIKDEIII